MRILHIFGTRPQFVKVAMLRRAWGEKADQYFLNTGQHYSKNLSRIFMNGFELPQPDVELDVRSGSSIQQIATMLSGIESFILSTSPDCVFVYGDTNSTLAGALTASKMGKKLVHVEAGLRSFDRNMPEEINRVITDHLSDLLFCPTKTARENLLCEGITTGVMVSGDVMADALASYIEKVNTNELVERAFHLRAKEYCVLTLHRQKNVDSIKNLQSIFSALEKIGSQIIFPIHPRTAKMLELFHLNLPENTIAVEPVGYLEMLALMKEAECVLTDSGGLQKEAYLLGIRCITLRNETEWVETQKAGWNILTGANSAKILSAYTSFHPQGVRPPIFGDYHAAEKIVKKTMKWMEDDV